MLHELLVALLGFTGKFFIETENDIRLAENISLVQPSERNVLNEIVKVGFYYKNLETFFRKKSKGMYFQALQKAIQVHLLAPYRQCILDLEKIALKDGILLSLVQQNVDQVGISII